MQRKFILIVVFGSCLLFFVPAVSPWKIHPIEAQSVSKNIKQNAFKTSLDAAQNMGTEWLSELPDCPCLEPNLDDPKGEWEAPSLPQRLPEYHPGATSSIRSKNSINGHSQQCTYLNKKLITGGAAAGTPDFYTSGISISGVQHLFFDVDHWKVLGWRLYSNYWKPNQGLQIDPISNDKRACDILIVAPVTLSPGYGLLNYAMSKEPYILPSAYIGQKYTQRIAVLQPGDYTLDLMGGPIAQGITFSIIKTNSQIWELSGMPSDASEANTTFMFSIYAKEKKTGYTGSESYQFVVLPNEAITDPLAVQGSNNTEPIGGYIDPTLIACLNAFSWPGIDWNPGDTPKNNC